MIQSFTVEELKVVGKVESNTVIHGDCLDAFPYIPDASIDCVISDIPSGRTACAWDSVIPFEPMWAALKRVVKKHAPIVLLGCTQPFTSALVMSNLGMFKYDWVWEKTRPSGFLHVKYQPMRIHESIVVFGLGRASHGTGVALSYNPQFRAGTPYKERARKRSFAQGGARLGRNTEMSIPVDNIGTRYPSSVLKFANDNNGSIHPTQKPLALLEYLVKTYTNPCDTVLDFTFGSATCGVACLATGRSFIGIEKDAEYFKLGSDRMQAKREELQNTLFSYDTTDIDKSDSPEHLPLQQSQIHGMA